MDEKYINFFKKIRFFKEEQKKQKQRGLNDYNMVNVVRKENAEVGMHSNVIYSLINPQGLHYQDDLFLNKFITIVLGEKIENFGSILSVQAEELTFENRRIDFTIKSTNYYIGIEMKIDANDLNNQINDYEVDLITKAKNENIENVVIYYLTKDGKEAAQHSCKDVTYKRISFENHILNWIENCQKEVRNITNLNEAFENYKDIVKKITNKYEGRVMSLKDELLKNEEYFKLLIKEIQPALMESKIEIQTKFWEELKNELIQNGYNFEFVDYKFNKINNINRCVNDYYKMSKNNKYYGLKHDVMKISDIHTLSFFIQIDWNIYFGFTIKEYEERKDIAQNEKFTELSTSILNMNQFKENNKNTVIDRKWWICWKYPKKKLNFYSFTSDNIFDLVDENKRKKIISDIREEIVDVITTFKQSQEKQNASF